MRLPGVLIAVLILPAAVWADPGSRIWATGGVTSIEGC